MTDRPIAPGPTGREIATLLAISAVAITVTTSLPPVLLGGLVAEGRLTLVELGQTATAELIAMAIACSAAGVAMATDRLRPKAAMAGAGLVVANLLTLMADHGQIVAARALSGACFGIYMWILTALLVRTSHAARYAGWVTTIQAVVGVGMSAGFGALARSRYGINGGYGALVLASLAITAAAPFLPRAFAPLPAQRRGAIPPVRGMVGLLVIFLYLAGIIGMWVYIGALAGQSGYTVAQTGTAVAIALAAQVAGGLVAALSGPRIPPLPALAICGVALFALAAAMTLGLPIGSFYLLIAAFGLLWMFSTPMLIPMILQLDPSRISGLYAITMQMIGAACGPAIGALFITGGDVRGAVLGAGAMLVTAVALAVVTRLVPVTPPHPVA